jgi:membrane protein
LIPGAIAAAAGQVVVSAYSALWMPRVVASDAARYGLIGVTFALISWLIVISLAVVAGAVLAAELAPEGAVERARGDTPDQDRNQAAGDGGSPVTGDTERAGRS